MKKIIRNKLLLQLKNKRDYYEKIIKFINCINTNSCLFKW